MERISQPNRRRTLPPLTKEMEPARTKPILKRFRSLRMRKIDDRLWTKHFRLVGGSHRRSPPSGFLPRGGRQRTTGAIVGDREYVGNRSILRSLFPRRTRRLFGIVSQLISKRLPVRTDRIDRSIESWLYFSGWLPTFGRYAKRRRGASHEKQVTASVGRYGSLGLQMATFKLPDGCSRQDLISWPGIRVSFVDSPIAFLPSLGFLSPHRRYGQPLSRTGQAASPQIPEKSPQPQGFTRFMT